MEARRRCGPVPAALLVAAVVVSACTPASSGRPESPPGTPAVTPTITTVAELRAAIARWHRTPATVTYRTERQRPGSPESVHQCLRAVVEERSGVAAALRYCDPSGIATLVWDPPRGWRLDVEEAGTMTTAIVVGDDGLICRGEPSCRPRTVEAILGDLPFVELIAGVAETARRAELSVDGPITMTADVVAGIPVRCLERRSGASAARWCFADDGALLSLELETEGHAPTIIEATRVSDEVDDARFYPLAG
ncbi:MAG TPA: hypothetical protein VF108_09335 [Actinomycetota bacterium]